MDDGADSYLTLPSISPGRNDKRVYYRFQPMVSKPLIIRLRKRQKLLWGVDITTPDEIKNRHRLSPVLNRFAQATPETAVRLLKKEPEIQANATPNNGCYDYLLPKKNHRSKSVPKASSKNKSLLQMMLQRDPGIEKIMQLNKEVAKFANEVKRENIKKKKNKYIAQVFDHCRRPPSPPRAIKTTNLFKDVDIEDSPAYFEYQLLNKVKKEAMANINTILDERKKEYFQALPWRKSAPKVVAKGGYKSPILDKTSRDSKWSPSRLDSRAEMFIDRRNISTNIEIGDDSTAAYSPTIREKDKIRDNKERKEFVKKFKESLINPMFKMKYDMTDVESLLKHVPKMKLIKFRTLDD